MNELVSPVISITTDVPRIHMVSTRMATADSRIDRNKYVFYQFREYRNVECDCKGFLRIYCI